MEPVVWKKIAYAVKQDLVADLEISSIGEVRSVVSKRLFSMHIKDNQKHFERQKTRIPLRHALTETFLGPMGPEEEVEFIDGDKMNCVLSNLRYRPKVRRGEEGTNAVIIPPIAPMTLDNRLMRMEAKIIELTCYIDRLDDKLYDLLKHLVPDWTHRLDRDDGEGSEGIGGLEGAGGS